jgi:MFS family permease
MSQTLDFPAPRSLEKKILRKLDLRVLPILALIYEFALRTKINPGNPLKGQVAADLDLRGEQPNIAFAAFFITYILSQLPSNIIMKKLKFKRWISFLIGNWGMGTIMTGSVAQNYTGIVALRLIGGLFEGGLLAGVPFYMSCLYNRYELQSRVGIVFVQAILLGQIKGLAVQKLGGVPHLATWRWEFILAGLEPILLAIAAIFLPTDLSSAKFLTEEERGYASWRLKQDKSFPKIGHHISLQAFPPCATSGLSIVREVTTEPQNYFKAEDDVAITSNAVASVQVENTVQEEGFEWCEIQRGFFDIQTWLTGVASLGLSINLYSFLFLFPIVVQEFGYSGIQVQLHSLPPYIAASVLIIVVSILSDRLKLRGPCVLVCMILTIIGYLLVIAGKTNVAQYAGCVFIACGTSASMPCLVVLLANNTRGYYRRATSMAVQFSLSSIGVFLATLLYTSDQEPGYMLGHVLSFAFAIVVLISVTANVVYCMRKNEERRVGLGGRDPDFRFTL